MKPRVSVVIPAYNAAQFIRSSVESALSQTLADIEVVIVDDGSVDGTADVVRAIEDPRVRLVQQDNAGQSAACNRGATESRGDFLKFLDADDWLNPAHLEAQLAAGAGRDDIAVSCRWGYFVGHPGAPRIVPEHTNRDYDDPIDWIIDSLSLDEGMMGGWMWLIPRPVWDRSGGWDERLSLNNDFDFSIRLLLSSSGVAFARDAVYSYREGVHGALSATRGRAAMESAFNTTDAGCRRLLSREDSPRVRSVCADRWQRWVYVFYPQFPDLAERAEREVTRLGGSGLKLEGGTLLRLLEPVVGWRAVRRMQVRAYQGSWASVLQWKARRRLEEIRRQAGR